MSTGWIKLHRQMLEWEWYQDINVKVLFIHLLLKANINDYKWRGNDYKRGSLITSIDSLAEQTNLSAMQVRVALKKLEKTQEITRQITSKFSIITICKYDFYNAVEIENNKQNNNQITSEQQTNNKQITSEQQTNNKQITIGKEYKNIRSKEIKKERNKENVVCSNTGETANSTQPTDNNNTQNNLKHDLEMLLNDEDLKSTFENQNFTYEQTIKKFEQYFKSNKRTTKTKGFEDTRKFYVWWSSKVLPTLKPINNNAPAAQTQRKIAAKEMPTEWRKIVGRLTMFFQVRVDSFITTMEKFWIFCGSPENIDFQDGLSEIAQKFETYCQQGKIGYKTLDQIDFFDSWFWIQEERNSNIKIA